MPIHDPEYAKNQLRRAFKGNYRPHGDPADAECVLAAGFGYRERDGLIDPGLSNADLAHFLHSFEHLPKLVERSVANAYRQVFMHDEQLLVDYHHTDRPLADKELADHFFASMTQKGWQRALLIAHPNYLPWFDFLCGQRGIRTIVPAGLQHIRFDPESALPWTRSLIHWQQELQSRKPLGNPRALPE